MTEQDNKSELKLPRKPREPELYECCQRNCINCVFVHYNRAMERWEAKMAAIEAAGSGEINQSECD